MWRHSCRTPATRKSDDIVGLHVACSMVQDVRTTSRVMWRQNIWGQTNGSRRKDRFGWPRFCCNIATGYKSDNLESIGFFRSGHVGVPRISFCKRCSTAKQLFSFWCELCCGARIFLFTFTALDTNDPVIQEEILAVTQAVREEVFNFRRDTWFIRKGFKQRFGSNSTRFCEHDGKAVY